MAEKRRSFLDLLFGAQNHSERQSKVLRHVIHRMGEGARLHDVMGEEYVLRNLTGYEIEQIITNPELIHASREQLEKAFASGELDPHVRPNA